MKGRLHTRYAPVRRSLNPKTYTPRLACVKPAASVHPEPGSNSSSYIVILYCDDLSIGSFRILQFYYSYSLVLTSLLKRLSIQYVYERVFFIIPPVFQSGCKTKNSFCFLQEKIKVFFSKFLNLFFFIFLSVSQGTSRICGVQM